MGDQQRCIGVVSAGAMGGALGRTWRGAGARVVTTVAGRSEQTAVRARDAGLELVADLDALVSGCDVVTSIAPPDQAVRIAGDVAAAARRTGARPVFADLNATAPGTVERLAETLRGAGLRLLDGTISGPPPRPGGPTMLYLSGPDADLLAAIPADGLRTRVVGAGAGTASAVKMCTASVLKGFDALLTQAMITARQHGVEEWVVADLAEKFPAQLHVLPRELALAASKAWRYVAEMHEIAETQAAAGARRELFEAMAAVWGMVSDTAAGHEPAQPGEAAALSDVLDALRRPGG